MTNRSIETVLAADGFFSGQLLEPFSALISARLQHARQRTIEEWRPEAFA
jgi:hypothetical protein